MHNIALITSIVSTAALTFLAAVAGATWLEMLIFSIMAMIGIYFATVRDIRAGIAAIIVSWVAVLLMT